MVKPSIIYQGACKKRYNVGPKGIYIPKISLFFDHKGIYSQNSFILYNRIIHEAYWWSHMSFSIKAHVQRDTSLAPKEYIFPKVIYSA